MGEKLRLGTVNREAEPGTGPTFRQLLERDGVVKLAGAHNPLGAVLAEQVGFDGVWSSGLEISASQALPDADIMTMSELLAVAGSMAERVGIPVIADCDAGYGNVPNVAHMVRRYEAAGVSAVSIEDKRYPKMNSFVGVGQHLLPVDEFCAKIVAARTARRSDDLVIIARVEALIAGLTVDEALERAHRYVDAGADVILIHARGADPTPILDFLAQWAGRVPTAVVPTTYHTVTAQELYEAGAKVVIYANHGLRAQINAVRQTFQQILEAGRTTEIESAIASVADVFELQGLEAMLHHEEACLSEARDIAVNPLVFFDSSAAS